MCVSLETHPGVGVTVTGPCVGDCVAPARRGAWAALGAEILLTIYYMTVTGVR